ncbi:heparinase II/III family protein [Sphingomonas abietis]|uniref:Heparinase II/III family protein n=1 Tax=Sphingomonas abietis TaxID=3012344 RepID=A0ABY7NLW2_9SPHN|nr:heparinase II/III family protein [Sphingomonas abietis]WBO22489.1 heparinase II/III family protein [Sphingomonas abietis]
MAMVRRIAEGHPPETPEDGIEPGRRLIRVGDDKGQSLTERVAARFNRLTWNTPFHALRLRGRFPLKLLGVPRDPIVGDREAGLDIMDGEIVLGRDRADTATIDFAAPGRPAGFADHLQSFAWLRDLAAAGTRLDSAPYAEALMRRWLDRHAAAVDEAGWRPDLWGRRILNWAAHAPLILSSSDLVYRSTVLNTLARGARHLDRTAERAPIGLPRIAAYAGSIAAGLLISGGEPRLVHGEQAMAKALAQGVHPDGGIVSRSPIEQVELIELLSQLIGVYEERRREPPAAIATALAKAVPVLLGVTMGDGALSSWQGGGPLTAERVARAVAASGIRTRPLRQSREWGFQRLSGGASVVVADCAPPPASRLARGGCASTLAFELSDGPQRIIVNCGGDKPWAALPSAISEALRTSAAHSTLVLADSNSTAIHIDGSLGKGVTLVELDRQEQETASRIEATHDGYVRRLGLQHRRKLALSSDGKELGGEDILLPTGARKAAGVVTFALRFHLAPGVEATATADGLGALLRIDGGPLWQFRCRGGALAIEESIWIDGAGRPAATSQLVVTGQAPAGGTSISWALKRAG